MSVVEDPQPTRRRLPLNVSDNDGLAPRQDEDGLNDTPAVNIEGELGAWICVLGAFIFVLPAFGMPRNFFFFVVVEREAPTYGPAS